MIRIIAVGKLKDRRLADLAADYQRRLRPYAQIEMTELRDQNPEREARQLLDHLHRDGGTATVVALDERGRDLSSRDLAQVLAAHGSLVFLIGGADGLTDEVRARADLVLGLSRLTFTHEMARVLLLEQIYRGFTILRGLPYHRD
ncbi:MAG: 23S rRNA (pseudouridine(1915)-N(3))-methyltransferase RlmH [Candidatus Krumholzibacteriia bacterium]